MARGNTLLIHIPYLLDSLFNENVSTPMYTLSGSTAKVVASHAEIAFSSPGMTEAVLIYM